MSLDESLFNREYRLLINLKLLLIRLLLKIFNLNAKRISKTYPQHITEMLKIFNVILITGIYLHVL